MSRHTLWLCGAAILGLALAGMGCASSAALRQGLRAEQRQDYDQAVIEYTKALRAHPDNREARDGLGRSRLRAAQDHFSRGRRLAATTKYDEALAEFELASELNPSSAEIDQARRDVGTKLRTKVAVTRDGKTDLEALIEQTRDLPPPGLGLPRARMPASLIFRDASSRDVFIAIARLADISVVFDSTFRDAPTTVDLRNASLDDALTSVTSATRTFIRVTAANTITVIPDTPAKRREYDEEIVRTFYLSNADLKETMDLLRLTVEVKQVAPSTSVNAITIKDTPEHVAAASRVIAAIDKARPEVIIDVQLLEVDRTKLLEYGLQLASPSSPGINGQAAIVPNQAQTTTQTSTVSLQSLQSLASLGSSIGLANLPGLYYRLLKSDTNTRTLANPQLRTSDGIPAQARFGDRVPVPVTTFAPIATGGTAQQPITSYNYENIGVNIDITPRIHHDDDVTLTLKMEVSSIESTTGFGGLPEFSNRQVNTVIRLRDGETSLLAGLLREDETKLIEGIPGLSGIPAVGRLFSHTQNQTDQTDVMLILTPHIVRVLDLTERDLRPFQVGRTPLSPIAERSPVELVLAPRETGLRPPLI